VATLPPLKFPLFFLRDYRHAEFFALN